VSSSSSAGLAGSTIKNGLRVERLTLQSEMCVKQQTETPRFEVSLLAGSLSGPSQQGAGEDSDSIYNKGVVRVLSTLPPPSSVVHDGTPHNSTLTAPGLPTSALHDNNSDNKSPSGVGGSDAFSLWGLFLNRV